MESLKSKLTGQKNSGGACPLIPMESQQVDSPTFREMARNSSEWTVNVSARVRHLSKQLAQLKELECAAAVARKQLLNEFESLHRALHNSDGRAECNGADCALADDVTELTSTLVGIEDLRMTMEDTLQVKLNIHLQDFVQGPVQEALETYKAYQRSCTQLDTLLAKTTKSSKNQRTATMDAEAQNAHHAHYTSAVDSAKRLNTVTQRLPVEVACAMWEFADEERKFNDSVAQRFVKMQEVMRDMADKSSKLTSAIMERAKDATTQAAEATKDGGVNAQNGTTDIETRTDIEGYLFKQSSSIRKGWHRRYFVIRDGELRFYKDTKSRFAGASSGSSSAATTNSGANGEPSTPDTEVKPAEVFDVVLTTVRPRDDLDRGFCFELVTPQRKFLLQAENETQYKTWISVLGNAREHQLKVSSASVEQSAQSVARTGIQSPLFEKEDSASMLQVLWDLEPENRVCCDCGAPDPDWVSINLGLLCCINCSGIHRSLGVSFSKVRSVKLDSIDPEVFLLIARLGNKHVNEVYEAKIPAGKQKIKPDSSHDERTAWIRAKYIEKLFTSVHSETDCTNSFYKACKKDSLKSMLFYFAHGANVDARFPPRNETSLHYTVKHKRLVASTFLLLNNANPNLPGVDNNTALHYSAMRSFPEIAAAIVRAGGDADLKNERGKTPAMLAEAAENAHCTTILRMAQVAKEETNHETRAAFLASMRECDHAIKATTIAKDLPSSMREEYALEHNDDKKETEDQSKQNKDDDE